MLEILRSSIIYRFIAAIGNWFGTQWRGSSLVTRCLSYGAKPRLNAGVLRKSAAALLRGWRTGCHALRLPKLLRGSVFANPFIWSVAALFLAPIVPTMAVLALVLVMFAATLLRLGTERESAFAYSPLNRFVWIFALVYSLSILLSTTISGSLRHGAMHVAFIAAAPVIGSAIDSHRKLERTLQALTLSAVAVSLYGVYQYVSGASGASAWVDSTMFTGISTRVYSTLENPNVLAGYLLLATPFVFALAITGEGQLTRIFYALCGAILLLCMVLTYARGGWLGLIVAAAVMLVFIDRRFILVGAVGLVALYFLTPQVILDRFLSIGDLSDGSTSYRLTIWLGTLSMLRDYWYSGIGPGVAAFNQVYPLYSYNTAVAQHSHNLFLQIMCDSGIVGLLTFSALLFTAFRLIAGTIRRLNVTHARRPASFYYLAAGAASLSGFLVQGMADYSFYNYRVTFVFWAILGIVAAACRLAISKDGER